MFRAIASISSLLAGMGIFLAGNGLLGLLVGLRGVQEGFSNFALGVVMSGFYLGYILGTWACPDIIRRVGHIRAFTAFAAGSAVAALAYGLLVNPLAWWLLRIVSGIFLLGLYMAIESWLNERTTEHRGQVFSIYVTISLLALGCGQYLLLAYGVSGLASFSIVAGLFCLGLIPVALTPVAQPEPIRTDRVSIRRLMAVSPVGAAGALVSGLVLGSFWSLAAVYGKSLSLTDSEVASFIVATIAGGTLLQWPIGWFSDHYDRRAVLILVSLAGALSLTFLMVQSNTNLSNLLVSGFGFGGFAFSVYSLAVAQTHDRFLNHESLEATRGVLLLHGIGAATGPIVTGAAMTWLTDGFALSLLAWLLILALFAGLRMLIDPPVPLTDRTPYSPMDQNSPIATDLDPRTPEPGDGIGDADMLTPDVSELPVPANWENADDTSQVDSEEIGDLSGQAVNG